MPPTLAIGPTPPDPRIAAVAQGASGLGAGLGAWLGQRLGQNRLAEELNPMRQALLQSLPGAGYTGPMASPIALAAHQARTPQQQMLVAAAQDPKQFAKLAGSAQGALALGGMLGAPQGEGYSVDRMVQPNTELGRSLGLTDRQARVRFNYDANGQLIGQPSLAANPLANDEVDGIRYNEEGIKRNMAQFAEGFASGTLTPEEKRAFEMSVVDYTQARTFTDPDTGLPTLIRNELPGYVRSALKEAGYTLQDTGGPQLTLIPPLGQQQPPDPLDVAAQQQAQAGSFGVAERPSDTPTLFEMAYEGDLNSPIPWAQRFLTRFGLDAQSEMTAATAAVTLKERLVKALQQSPRYAEGEAQRIGQGFQFDPEIIATNSRYMQRAIAADDALARLQQENYEVVTGKRALLPGETRQHAMATLNAITNVRSWLIPPRINSDAEAEQFNRLNPPGTPALWQNEQGQWELLYTTGAEDQGAQ